MTDVFSVYKPPPSDSKFVAYWVESTAPINVEDSQADPQDASQSDHSPLLPEDPQTAIDTIADFCVFRSQAGKTPSIVVFVHGFNSPIRNVIKTFVGAYDFVVGQMKAGSELYDDTIGIGYHWPSEQLGVPWATRKIASPLFFGVLQWVNILFALLGLGLAWFARELALAHHLIDHWLANCIALIIVAVAVVLFGLTLTLAMLRAIVYFRDNYRAMNFGVLDLVEWIRQIDKAIYAKNGHKKLEQRVELSFIGHSMGGFVVTNTIRILTDVFSTDSIGELSLSNMARTKAKQLDSTLGHAFTLARLVLVSPDIPAEALLTARANFLQPSLRRVREAYLFSNEGDVVLSQVSTLGNYFGYPTRTRSHGQRLGNVRVVAEQGAYGIVSGAPGRVITVGGKSLDELSEGLGDRLVTTSNFQNIFTYFDCTDYKDEVNGVAPARGVVSLALRKLHLSEADNLKLLYLYGKQRIDTHSGYFDAPLSRQLIFSLACIGYDETCASLNHNQAGIEGLNTVCSAKGIRVLIPPKS